MKILSEKSIHSEHVTMYQFYIQDKEIPHWKCVIICCSNFLPVNITYEKTQYSTDMTNIKYHIYKEVGHNTIHGKIPLGVISR